MKRIILSFLGLVLALPLHADSVQGVQSLDGASRNRLEAIINAAAGSSSSSGASTNVANTWTATQTFTAPINSTSALTNSSSVMLSGSVTITNSTPLLLNEEEPITDTANATTNTISFSGSGVVRIPISGATFFTANNFQSTTNTARKVTIVITDSGAHALTYNSQWTSIGSTATNTTTAGKTTIITLLSTGTNNNGVIIGTSTQP